MTTGAGGRRILAVGLMLCASVVHGQDEAPAYFHYGLAAGAVKPDAVRHASAGYEVSGLAGWEWDPAMSAEVNAFAAPGLHSYGAGLDVVLGRAVRGNLLFLLGAGAISEDATGTGAKVSAFGEAGLGAYLPFSWKGERWRIDARYNAIFDGRSYPGHDTLEDLRLNLGLVWGNRPTEPEPMPLALAATMDSDGDEVPDFRDRCPDTQFGVTVDSHGCPERLDADGDGVSDEFDRCPGTPRWVRPDPSGCTPDSDGDGVDNAHDACPDTAHGVSVDRKGCPAVTAPADADHDGVADERDRCPESGLGAAVDEQGCVRAEDVLARRVYFDLDSARLTADGYRLLHQIAAQLLRQPDLRIEVAGHTDSTGSSKHNRALADRRAGVVRDFLVAAGVATSRIDQRAYGATRPETENGTDEGRAGNRRVEFVRVQIKPAGQGP